ncbi:MAG: formyltransferase family protein [Alphaproteobacteria bacterium]
MDLLRRIPPHHLPMEVVAYLRTRYSGRLRAAIGWTRGPKPPNTERLEAFTRRIEVDNVNSPETIEQIRRENPGLIVIWGGSIVRPPVLELADHVINIHFGYSPYYRGTHCHMHAVLAGDWDRIGVTIHYAEPSVDAGDIIEIVQANAASSPKEMFDDLYRRSFDRYLAIATTLWRDGPVAGAKQNLADGRQFFIRDWNFRKLARAASELARRQDASEACSHNNY